MENRRETPQADASTEQYVPMEAMEELNINYAILRVALRDCLTQSGILSNPGWSDGEIVAHVAKKIGVENRYDRTATSIRKLQEQNIKLDTNVPRK